MSYIKNDDDTFTFTLFYATNRNHIGDDQWKPVGYDYKFSKSGRENLRFGRVKVKTIDKMSGQNLADMSGQNLADYFTKCAKQASEINAYEEDLIDNVDNDNSKLKLKLKPKADRIYGSTKFRADLQATTSNNNGHILIYIHGYNVCWNEAVGAALALEWMQNHALDNIEDKVNVNVKGNVEVVLFSWPSDGLIMPFLSYINDRHDARESARAFGRGMLKLRDYLHDMDGDCGRKLHLLCHSMGNYLLEKSLRHYKMHISREFWPQIFDQIFLCAADVGNDTFEKGKPLNNLHKLGEAISVYYNQDDKTLLLSRHTKLHSKRLGRQGATRSDKIQDNVQQIDCQQVVADKGIMEHSYYLESPTSLDIRQSIEDIPADDTRRNRKSSGTKGHGSWILKPPKTNKTQNSVIR